MANDKQTNKDAQRPSKIEEGRVIRPNDERTQKSAQPDTVSQQEHRQPNKPKR